MRFFRTGAFQIESNAMVPAEQLILYIFSTVDQSISSIISKLFMLTLRIVYLIFISDRGRGISWTEGPNKAPSPAPPLPPPQLSGKIARKNLHRQIGKNDIGIIGD